MMNVNNYGPKSVNLDEEMKKVPTYAGTLTELKTLVDENKLVLVKTSDGTVTGFWMESGLSGMLDNLAGYNFARAYCCKPVMDWLQLIMDAKYKGPAIERIDEEEGIVVYVDGVATHFKEGSRNTTASTSDLPESISLEDLELDEYASDREIRRAIKNYTGYFVARDCDLYVEDGTVYDIEYGRKASEAELD